VIDDIPKAVNDEVEAPKPEPEVGTKEWAN